MGKSYIIVNGLVNHTDPLQFSKWCIPWGYNPLILTSNGTSKYNFHQNTIIVPPIQEVIDPKCFM